MEILGWAPISYMLILISIIVTLGVWSRASLMKYGFHREYYAEWQYIDFLKQFSLFQFIHGDILHIVMNSYFLYTAGPMLEKILGSMNFFIFFFTTTIFSVIALYIFAPKSNTIGISWFCMAILSYLWIALYTLGDSSATSIGTLLLINIALGFAPGISLVGHASGALWGVIFWYITTNIL